jgi:hypothetical protein
LGEVLPLDELHDDREDVLVLDEVVDRDRSRMTPAAEDSGLAKKTPADLRIGDEVRVEAFDRDVASEGHVTRSIDDAHSSFSNDGLDPIDGERRSFGKTHRREAAGHSIREERRGRVLGGRELGELTLGI